MGDFDFTGNRMTFNLSHDLIEATNKIVKENPIKDLNKPIPLSEAKKDEKKPCDSEKKDDKKSWKDMNKSKDVEVKEEEKKDSTETSTEAKTGKVMQSKALKARPITALLDARKKPVKEDEKIEELSKATMSSYVKKAIPDEKEARDRHWDSKLNKDTKSASMYLKKSKNRVAGMNTAIDKLTKEDETIELDSEWIHEGFSYPTKTFDNEEDTAKFLEDHKETFGFIGEKGGIYHVASLTVEGTQIEQTQIDEQELNEKEIHSGLSPEAHDLITHADNDYNLEKSSKAPIMKNLSKKATSGSYDEKLGKKAWGYHADRAAMNYHKDFGDKSKPWHATVPTKVRKEAASHWEKTFREGNFEH